MVALPGLEPGLFALRGRRVNQLHHNAKSYIRRRIFSPALLQSIASRSIELKAAARTWTVPQDHAVVLNYTVRTSTTPLELQTGTTQ